MEGYTVRDLLENISDNILREHKQNKLTKESLIERLERLIITLDSEGLDIRLDDILGQSS